MRKKHKKPKVFDFDLLIIGSGPGGGVAAHLAANANKKVGLIEQGDPGGANAFYGTIPTRALLDAANQLWQLKTIGKYGIRSSTQSYNFRAVQLWKQKAMYATGVLEESDVFGHDKITLIKGRAHFVSPWTISVGMKRYSAKKIIIATGSVPVIPAIPGLNEAGFLTVKEASNLEKPPRSIFIIGGGKIAYEYSQIFSAFDSRVHIAEPSGSLIHHADEEVNDGAVWALEGKGIRVHLETQIMSVAMHGGRKIISLVKNDRMHRIVVEQILIAGEEHPALDMGLENCGISYGPKGIRVNGFLQTNKKHIYAIGSVIGKHSEPHTASAEARLAIHNIYAKKPIKYPFDVSPTIYYGTPEIAVVGKNEQTLRQISKKYQVGIAPIELIGSARTNDYSGGFVKLLTSKEGVIEGAAIISSHASENISELSLSVNSKIQAKALTAIPHPYSSESSAIQIAAAQITSAD